MPVGETIPTTIDEFLRFLSTHVPEWAEHAEELGLSEETIEALVAASAQAQATEKAKRLALWAYKGSLIEAETASARARALASAAVATIRAKAATEDDPTLLSTAGLDPKAAGGPLAAPGKPERFETRLLDMGQLLLTWKCANPRTAKGTVYEVRRMYRDAAGRETQYELLGTAGSRRYIDTMVPAGAASITYQITGVRGLKRGEPASFNVVLGVRVGGAEGARRAA
jgi:hypothetical protein